MKKTSRPASPTRSATIAAWVLAGVLLPGGCTWHRPPESTVARQRILQGVRASMVPVRVCFKRDIANEFPGEEPSFQERLARQMVERKMSLDLGGIVLDESGHVLITDPEIEPRLIDRIEVTGPDGRIHRARLKTLVKRMEAAVLEVTDPQGLQPVRFEASKDLEEFLSNPQKYSESGILPSLIIVSIYRSGRDWRISTGSLAGAFRYNSPSPAPEYLLGEATGGVSSQLDGGESMGTTPALIVDSKGNFVGVTIRGVVDLGRKDRIWQGRDVLSAATSDLNMKEFQRTQKALQEQYAQLYHQVKIYYRQPSDDDYDQPPAPERIVYGLALDSNLLLVPTEMSRREAKQIESIEVTLSEDQDPDDGSSDVAPDPEQDKAKTYQADFVGTYRDFAAFLVRINDGQFSRWLDRNAGGEISKVVPFHTIYARRRFGQKDLNVWYARCLRERKGYADAVHLDPSGELEGGSLLLDLQGRPAAFYLRERIPAEEQRVMELVGIDQTYQFGRAGSRLLRIFPLQEIAAALSDPAENLDPNIQAMTKSQAKRRMWLGVEYVPVNPELAKRLGLERLTKDGTIGLMVRAVYGNSPAETVGLRPGDVLLRIKDESRDYPTELRTSVAAQSRGGLSRAGRSDGGAMIWMSRRNFVTEFLAAIGQGRMIELTFCSRRGPEGWKTQTEQVEVQLAPLDYDSAARYRDRAMGLTVRDLTYEVRQALKMTTDQPGVVVSNVEEGTPAAVANIVQAELITRINSQDVRSVDDFEAKIAAARLENADTVKVEIVRLGKTRVRDLSLSD